MRISLTKILSKIMTFFQILIKNVKGQSIAEFAVITAMMSTFVATAAPRLSNLMEEGKTQKSIQEIDKLLMQAKTFYEFTSNSEGRGRLPGQDKFDIPVGGYTDTLEVFNDLVYFTSFNNDSIGSKWIPLPTHITMDIFNYIPLKRTENYLKMARINKWKDNNEQGMRGSWQRLWETVFGSSIRKQCDFTSGLLFLFLSLALEVRSH